MKPISIMIDSFESIDELRNLSRRKRGRPRKDTPSKSMKDLIDKDQSDLMTEPDFPLPKKG